MATKQLDYIATTPVAERKAVMPRIYCKDGVSLSVQASSRHYARTTGDPKCNDEGPWHSLEVGFISGAEAPRTWRTAWHCNKGENLRAAFDKHDRPDGDICAIMAATTLYCVNVDMLRGFIESHGGETENGKSADTNTSRKEIERAEK